jgi:hypothetical protein
MNPFEPRSMMQEHRSPNQASQHEEEKEQLDNAIIQILEHCNMAAPSINT